MKSFRMCSAFRLLHFGVLLSGIWLPYCTKALKCYSCAIYKKGPKNLEDPCYDPRRKGGVPIINCEWGSHSRICREGAGQPPTSSSTESNITKSTEAPTSTSEICKEPPFENPVDVCYETYERKFENDTSKAFLVRGCYFLEKGFKTCETYDDGGIDCYCNQRDLCNDEYGYQFGLAIGKAAKFKSPHALLGCFQLQLAVLPLFVLNSLY